MRLVGEKRQLDWHLSSANVLDAKSDKYDDRVAVDGQIFVELTVELSADANRAQAMPNGLESPLAVRY
jgi:hypothetical protein